MKINLFMQKREYSVNKKIMFFPSLFRNFKVGTWSIFAFTAILLFGLIVLNAESIDAVDVTVFDIVSGSGSSNPLHLVNVNGTLIFSADPTDDNTFGYGLTAVRPYEKRLRS